MPVSWSESNRLHSTRMREDAADYSISEDADKYEGDYENDASDDSYLDGAFDYEEPYAEDRYLDASYEDRYYLPEADFDIY